MKPNLLNSIKLMRAKTNVFDLSHDVKLSFNMGELVPIMCMEAIPGDKFDISCESLLRFAPLVSPVMHRMDVTMHYFFVPYRILWDNWEKWITSGDGFATPPAFPTLEVNTVNYNRLHDYLGIPNPDNVNYVAPETVSAMPFAAYAKIYNDYYRDQNLITELQVDLIDGDNTAARGDIQSIRQRAWEHDYFTAALPWAQKGPAVDIPLGDISLKTNWNTTEGAIPSFVLNDGTQPGLRPGALTMQGAPNNDLVSSTSLTEHPLAYDPDGSLEATPTTINDLRRAFKLQEWFERNARAGTRYVESILAHFGVKSSDKRLQRPEYITGTKSPVVISEILNTTGTDELPQGNMAGHGVSVTSGKYGKYYCEEHGLIMGIMSVMPKTAYQQGMPKIFTKTVDRYQYYWPEFANIGEQQVDNKEVYAYQAPSDGANPFGYVPRYTEYKFMNSRVAGDFRTSLDFWHMGRIFASVPHLNQEFINCDPTTRIFAVEDPDTQKMYAHVLNKVRAIRGMPKFGTPQF